MITVDFLEVVFTSAWYLVTEILKMEIVPTEWGPITGYSLVAMSAILSVVKWTIEAYVSKAGDKGKAKGGSTASTGTGGRLPK